MENLHPKPKPRKQAIRAAIIACTTLSATGCPPPALASGNFLAYEIRRSGKIVEEKKIPGSPERNHNVKSLSKSVLSILAGIAQKEGIIQDLDEDLGPLLWPGKAAPKVTWRHLLSMRSGFPPTSGKNYAKWVGSRDWVQYFLGQSKSGNNFAYSTGDSHLFAVALRKKLGRPLSSYAEEKLFSPLGISGVKWSRDPQGREFGGNDLSISFQGVSRIGQMLLQGGNWEGKSIVPSGWIKEMWAKQAEAPAEFVQFKIRGYGYFWWLVSLPEAEAACALGYGGQVLCLFPQNQAQVTLFTRAPQNPKEATRNWAEVQSFLKEMAPKIAQPKRP